MMASVRMHMMAGNPNWRAIKYNGPDQETVYIGTRGPALVITKEGEVLMQKVKPWQQFFRHNGVRIQPTGELQIHYAKLTLLIAANGHEQE